MNHWMWHLCADVAARLNWPFNPPASCVLNVTKRCDSRCRYCGIWSTNLREEPTLTQLGDVCRQIADLGVPNLVVSGGEPLLRVDIVQLVQLATALGLQVNLYTNGTHVQATLLRSLVAAGLSTLTLSLDTLDPVIYQQLRGVPFKHARRAIAVLEECADSRLRVRLACVVTALNLDKVPELVEYAERRNWSVIFQPYHQIPGLNRPELIPTAPGPVQEVVREICRLAERNTAVLNSPYYLAQMARFLTEQRTIFTKFRCTAGFSNLNVDVNLDVRPCFQFPPVGNLGRQSLKALWHSQDYCLTRGRMLRGECTGCWWVCHTEKPVSVAVPAVERHHGVSHGT